jgi:hypothetical protein
MTDATSAHIRLSHVVICVQPENLARAAADFGELLGTIMQGPVEFPDHGIRMFMAWDHGIEILSPVDRALATVHQQFLDDHGEGVFRVSFATPDRDAALTRAEQLGHTVLGRYNVGDFAPQWRHRLAGKLDSQLAAIYGVGINFCQLEEAEPNGSVDLTVFPALIAEPGVQRARGAVMNATLEDVTKKKQEPTSEEMVRRARQQGLSLTGPDGLLKQLTKTVLETALNQELTEHLGMRSTADRQLDHPRDQRPTAMPAAEAPPRRI